MSEFVAKTYRVEIDLTIAHLIGSKWRYAVHGGLWHLRGWIDDQVILRRWSRKRGWEYRCEPTIYFVNSTAWVRER